MRRGRLVLAQLVAFVVVLAVLAVNATGCEGGGGGGGELTSLSTRLSGGGKEGETLTVSEGTKVRDKATLTGKDASKATGKVSYKVYSESACKTLVSSAGEVTVSGESVSASSEEELEGGKAYYWQAHYGGDSNNAESTSPCTEVLDVQAKTSLATKLSGESREGEEITINEGSKAKDTATLSGTNSSSAGGKVLYKIFSDSKCEHLVKEAGEVTVSSGSVPASSEEELEGGKTYYWQATYKGDSLHLESTSACGKEILKVKAKTTLATTLSGNGEEGAELRVLEGSKVKDKATVEGTNHSTAEGKVLYKVYSDSKCEHLVKEAGEVTVSSGSVPASSEEELEGAKVYYWQATYKGDSLHQESTSTCGKEVLTVKAKTTLSTTLSGEGKEGAELTVLEGAEVKDDATLGGSHSSSAGGKVVYKVYSDKECKDLVAEAGEVTVSSGSVPSSSEEELEAGKAYYWQATYKGDSLHQESTSECGKEILEVKAKTTLATTLSGESKEGPELTVLEGSKVKDNATVEGTNSSTAEGKVLYKVYSDRECKDLVADAGDESVTSGVAAPSNEEELEGGKTYYWQAHYNGDGLHQESTSSCGSEVLKVKAKLSLSTTLSGEGEEGDEVEVRAGSRVKDTATLTGHNADEASGTVKYDIYSDDECKDPVDDAGEVSVTAGVAPPSAEVTLFTPGTYYWQATYSGSSLDEPSTSACGSEIELMKWGTTMNTIQSGGSEEGANIEVLEGSGVTDQANLEGADAPKAGGTVIYKIYSDKECKTLVAEAGEVTVSSGSIPASDPETLKAGIYYWQATYSGDSSNIGSASECGTEILHVRSSTSITTSLVSEDPESEEVSEGPEIAIPSDAPVADIATLGGSSVTTAEGTVTYRVYSDSKCEHSVVEAGEGIVVDGFLPPSTEELLSPGAYYWQATYSGDTLHAGSTSSCASESAIVKAATSLTTALTGEGQEGTEVTVVEGSPVSDTATLSGEASAMATGQVTYDVYSDAECRELVAEAGEVSVAGEIVPASDAEILPAGLYYWQASYSGDAVNQQTKSTCGSEITVVTPVLTTTLSSEDKSGATLEVLEDSAIHDVATLHGPAASAATGSLTYKIYSDDECHDLVTDAGTVTVDGAEAPPSEAETLSAGEYYWQVEYSGDAEFPTTISTCGEEIALVATTTTLTTSLFGEGKSGPEIEVHEGAEVHDEATLSGTNSSSAIGDVEYNVYADDECKQLVALAGDVSVSGGGVPASSTLTLPPGRYYWQASYLGGGINQRSSSTCGSEILIVTAPITTTLSSGETAGEDLVVPEGGAVVDKATLHGEHASSATGTVRYKIYANSECTELVTEAGEVPVTGEDVPASDEETLAGGGYYWQAEYTGDAYNPPATSICVRGKILVVDASTKYAALGDSFSAGVGVTVLPEWRKGKWEGEKPKYYEYTKLLVQKCLRSAWSWPGLVASAFYGLEPEKETEVFQQQPNSFIFRGCSGAETENLWNGAEMNGLWDEAVFAAPVGFWVPKPSQDMWLSMPGGTKPTGPNATIKLVTLTIGVNDAGFKSVLLKCLSLNWERWPRLPGMRQCQARMETAVKEAIPEIKMKLEQVLADIHNRAPQASIDVPFYPKVLDTAVAPLIPVGLGLAIVSRPWLIEPRLGELLFSAASWIEFYTRSLNEELQRAVKSWDANRNIARVLPGTEAAFPAGVPGNRLGDKEPWMNGLIVRLNYRENFHPNCWGDQAVARKVLAGIGWAGPAPKRKC